MKKQIFLFIFSLMVALLGAGCWDNQDISKRTFVTAIAVDKAGDESSTEYKLTFEVLNPTILLFDSTQPTSILKTVDSESIIKGLEKLQTMVPYPVTLDFIRLILVGEDIAKHDFKSIADFVERNPNMGLRIQLMFVRGQQASEVLQTVPTTQKYISEELINMAQAEHDNPFVCTNSFIDFINELREAEGRGLAGGVTSIGSKNIIYSGAAVFNDWRLIGWLDETETQAVNWLIGKTRQNVTAQMETGLYIYKAGGKSTRITPRYDEGKLKFDVKVKTDGIILEERGPKLDFTKTQELEKLEKVVSETITEQIYMAISKAQGTFEVDYLGFGNALKNDDPESFNKIDWEQVFPGIQINVEVDSGITGLGLIE